MSRLTDFFKTGGQYEHSPMMHVQDQKANGTAGGAAIAGDNDRDLNTTLVNEIAGATLINNEVTLAAGRYYIEADPSSYRSESARSFVKDSLGNILLQSPNVHNNLAGHGGATVPVRGDITLLVETTIKVVTFNQTGDLNGLGRATNSTANTEVYTDLRIWQLDAIKTSPIIHDNKLYPLPGNTYVTGGMYGLEYSYTSANSITVDAGICYDSLNTTLLTGSVSQVVAIGTTINQIYNLFLCDDGLVKTDTNVEGTTLLAGSVTALRWIGFVRTDSSGNICRFRMSVDTITWMQASKSRAASLTTNNSTFQFVNLSILCPISRVSHIGMGAQHTSATAASHVLYSLDGTYATYSLMGTPSSYVSYADIGDSSWGHDPSTGPQSGMMPFNGSLYVNSGDGLSASIYPLLHAVKLRR